VSPKVDRFTYVRDYVDADEERRLEKEAARAEKAKAGRTPPRTIASLGLDVAAARAGKTWLLLPQGFRAEEFGLTYPLPSSISDLETLYELKIPPRKADSGCRYLHRAHKKYRERAARAESRLHDIGRREHKIKYTTENYIALMKRKREEANAAVEDVRKAAEMATASLTDLFSLGRRGLEEQMQAYLDGKPLRGETIDSKAFRDCFRMVTQAVKGLGLPDPQRKNAADSIMEQAAEAIRRTRGAMSDPKVTESTEEVDISAEVDPNETKH